MKTFPFILLASVISCVLLESQAQVNFSPAWGKRASFVVAPGRNPDASLPIPLGSPECKPTLEDISRIVTLLEVEAQRLNRCIKSPPEILN